MKDKKKNKNKKKKQEKEDREGVRKKRGAQKGKKRK